MKKIIFLISFLISVVTVNAQYSVTYCSNSTINTYTIPNSISCVDDIRISEAVGILYPGLIALIDPANRLIKINTTNINVTYYIVYGIYCGGTWVDYSLTVNYTAAVCNITSIENTIITSSIEVYPNPFTDNVNLKVNALESSLSTIILTDVTGKVYENKEVELTEGENNINIPVNCPKGLYLLSLKTANNETITYKIIK